MENLFTITPTIQKSLDEARMTAAGAFSYRPGISLPAMLKTEIRAKYDHLGGPAANAPSLTCQS